MPGTMNQRLCRFSLNQARGGDLQAFDGEVRQESAQIAQGDEGGVGIAPVEDHLQRCGLAAGEALAETGAEVDHEQGLAAVDQRGDLAVVIEAGDLLEHRRAAQSRQHPL